MYIKLYINVHKLLHVYFYFNCQSNAEKESFEKGVNLFLSKIVHKIVHKNVTHVFLFELSRGKALKKGINFFLSIDRNVDTPAVLHMCVKDAKMCLP